MIVLNMKAKPYTRAEAIAALMLGRPLRGDEANRLLVHLVRPRAHQFPTPESWVASFVEKSPPPGTAKWMGFAFSNEGSFCAAGLWASAAAPTSMAQGWYAVYGQRRLVKVRAADAFQPEGAFPWRVKVKGNASDIRQLDDLQCEMHIIEGRPMRLYRIGEQCYHASTIERCFWKGSAEICRYGEKGDWLYGRNDYGDFMVYPTEIPGDGYSIEDSEDPNDLARGLQALGFRASSFTEVQ
jgi:hypothetical protein